MLVPRGPAAAPARPSLAQQTSTPPDRRGRGPRPDGEGPRWGAGRVLSAHWLVAVASVGMVYFLAGKLGLALASVNASVSPVWPPTGIAIAAVLLFGRRIWPAVFVGAFLYNLTTAGTVWTSLAIACGNTAEGLVGAWLTQRFAGGRRAFRAAQGVLRFTVAAALAAALSASVGFVSLAAAGLAPWDEAGTILLTWWAGDALGAVLVTPLLVLWADLPRIRVDLAVWAHSLFLVFVAAVTVYLVFDGRVRTALPLVLVLMWPALRFGPRATVTLAAGISAVAVVATLAGRGPFQQERLNDTLLLLQLILASSTVFALVVAGVVQERRQAEERAHEAQLQRAAAELEEARRMSAFKTQFINIASHELKTPLLPIQAQIYVLREEGPRMDPADYDRSMAVLERNFGRISLLVQDLLDAGRLQADRIPLHLAPTDLAQVVRETAESFRDAAAAGGVALTAHADGPVVVQADEARISQVVYNLLSNALKCTPPGGRVDVEAALAGPAAVVAVRDTGVGLDPDQLAKLFAPFTQVHGGDAPEAKGTGLGLYISQGLVQRHGGSIWCESPGRGKGATLSFSLPLRPMAPPLEPRPVARSVAPPGFHGAVASS